MATDLSFEQIQKCKKVFDDNKSQISNNNNNNNQNEETTMPYNNLIKALNELDFDMNGNDIRTFIDDLGIDVGENSELDFPLFLKIAGSKFKQLEFNSALEDAFKSFDKESNNYLNYEQMKTILTDYGEKISSEDADRLLAKFMTEKEKFDYKEFIKKNF